MNKQHMRRSAQALLLTASVVHGTLAADWQIRYLSLNLAIQREHFVVPVLNLHDFAIASS